MLLHRSAAAVQAEGSDGGVDTAGPLPTAAAAAVLPVSSVGVGAASEVVAAVHHLDARVSHRLGLFRGSLGL